MKKLFFVFSMVLALMIPFKSNAQANHVKDGHVPAEVVLNYTDELPRDIATLIVENLEIDSEGNVSIADLIDLVQGFYVLPDHKSDSMDMKLRLGDQPKLTGNSIQERLLEEWLLNLLEWLGWLK